MNNNDFTMFFIIMSLINFSIGISKSEKNDIESVRQERIETKLDKILELLDNG